MYYKQDIDGGRSIARLIMKFIVYTSCFAVFAGVANMVAVFSYGYPDGVDLVIFTTIRVYIMLINVLVICIFGISIALVLLMVNVHKRQCAMLTDRINTIIIEMESHRAPTSLVSELNSGARSLRKAIRQTSETLANVMITLFFILNVALVFVLGSAVIVHYVEWGWAIIFSGVLFWAYFICVILILTWLLIESASLNSALCKIHSLVGDLVSLSWYVSVVVFVMPRFNTALRDDCVQLNEYTKHFQLDGITIYGVLVDGAFVYKLLYALLFVAGASLSFLLRGDIFPR